MIPKFSNYGMYPELNFGINKTLPNFPMEMCVYTNLSNRSKFCLTDLYLSILEVQKIEFIVHR